MKQNMTLIKLIDIWQNLKQRREALGMTQPEMAEAIGSSLSAYTHYETSGEGLTVDRLMRIDGMIAMMEKTCGKSVDNRGDKKGKNYRGVRMSDVIPKEYTPPSTAKMNNK